MSRSVVVLALAILLATSSTASKPEVIGGHAVPERYMTRTETALIFTMRQKRWDTGQPIRVVVYEQQSPLQIEFLYRVLGVSELAYESQLNRMIYLGRTQPPLRVKTEQELIKELVHYPYAIGYVHDAVLYHSTSGIVVIRILP